MLFFRINNNNVEDMYEQKPLNIYKRYTNITRLFKIGVMMVVLFLTPAGRASAQNCLGTWSDESGLQAPYPPCAPVTYGIELKIRVLQSISPSDFSVGIEWGDGQADYTIAGSGAAWGIPTPITVLGTAYYEYSLPTVVTHEYDVTANCRYDLKIYVQFRNPSNKCYSTKKYRVNVWSMDSQGMGQLVFENDDTHSWEYLVCEGKPFEITFRDLTHLACNTDPNNADLAYDYNAILRQTVFTYGITGSNIPDVFVGPTRVTSAATPGGNGTPTVLTGPVNTIPLSGDFAVNQNINFPTPIISNTVGNTTVGQIFNMQLANHNVCNSYPSNPQTIDARIRVVASPPKPNERTYEFCHSNHYNTMPNLTMNVTHESALGSMSGGTYRWYAADAAGNMTGAALVTTTSNQFNPAGRSTGGRTVAANMAGTYIFYVTYEYTGGNTGGIPCTTDPVKMTWIIRDDISAAPSGRSSIWRTADCAGSTFSVGYTNAPATQTNGGTTEYFWEVTTGNAIVQRAGNGQTAQIQLTGNPVSGATQTVTIRIHREWVNSINTNTTDLATARPSCKFTYSSGNGCNFCPGDADTYTITINPLPQANLVNPDAELCANDPAFSLTVNGLYGRLSGTTNNLTVTITTGTDQTFSTSNNGSGTFSVNPANGTVFNYQITLLKDNVTECESRPGDNTFTRLNGGTLNLGTKITNDGTANGYAQIRKRDVLTTPTVNAAPTADLCPGQPVGTYNWTASALPVITLSSGGIPAPTPLTRNTEYSWRYTGGLTGTTPVTGTAGTQSFATIATPAFPNGTSAEVFVQYRYTTLTQNRPGGNTYCPSDETYSQHTVVPVAQATITNPSQTICNDNTMPATISISLQGLANSDWSYHWELEKTTGPGSVAVVAGSGATPVTVTGTSNGLSNTTVSISPANFGAQPRHGTYTFRIISITQVRGACAGVATNTGTIAVREEPAATISGTQNICEKTNSDPVPVTFNISNGTYTIKYVTNKTGATEQTVTNLPNTGATFTVPASQINEGSTATTVTITAVTHTVGDQVCSGTGLGTHTITTVKPKSAGGDKAECSNSILMTAEAAGTGETGTWILINGSGNPIPFPAGFTVSNINDPTATVSVGTSDFGTYRLKWEITPGGERCAEIINVSFGTEPDIGQISAPNTQCGLTATLTGLSTGVGGGSGLLTDGKVHRWETGVWALKSGPGTIVTPSPMSGTPTGPFPGINFPAGAGSYKSIISEVTRDDSHDLNVTVSQPGKYVFVWFIKSPCGTPTEIEHEVEFIAYPQTNQVANQTVCPVDHIDIIFMDKNDLSQSGSNPLWLIDAAGSQLSNSDISYTWQFNGKSFSTNPTSLATVDYPTGLTAPSNNGTTNINYTMDVTGRFRGCTGTMMSFTITVKPKPQLTNTGDKPLCPDEKAGVWLNPQLTGSNIEYTWWHAVNPHDVANPASQHPNAGMANGTQTVSTTGVAAVPPYQLQLTGTQPTLNYPNAEAGKLRVIAEVNGCVSDTAMFNVTVNPRPDIELSAPGVEYCSKIPVFQRGTANDAHIEFWSEVLSTSYTWKNTGEATGLTLNSELAAIQIPGNNRYTTDNFTTADIYQSAVNRTGTVVITATSSAGCVATNSFNIVVKPRPVLTTTFINSSQALCPPPTNTNFAPIMPAVYHPSGRPLEYRFEWTPQGLVTDFDPDPTAPIAGGIRTRTITGGSSWTGIPVPVAEDGVNRTATFTVTPVMDGCPGESEILTLTAYVRPILDPIFNLDACSRENFPQVNFTTNTTHSVEYHWSFSGANVGKEGSGGGFIDGFLSADNTTGNDMAATVTVTATSTPEGCISPDETFTYTIYPAPVINPVTANPAFSSGTSFCPGEQVTFPDFTSNIAKGSVNVLYDWTVVNPAIGVRLPGYTITDTLAMRRFTGGGNVTGGNISTSVTVNARSSDLSPVTGLACASLSPMTFPLVLKPAPKMDPVSDKEYCPNYLVQGGILLKHNVTSSPYNGVEWSIDNTAISKANLTTPVLSSNGPGSFPEFFTDNPNTTPVNIVATVTMFATVNQCAGDPIDFKITVKPTPDIQIPEDMSYCIGEQPGDIVLSSANFPGSVFYWERSGDFIGLSDFSGDTKIPNFTTVNNSDSYTSLSPQIAFFSIWTDFNLCESSRETFSMTVLPRAQLIDYPSFIYCAGDTIMPKPFDSKQKAAGYDYTYKWEFANPLNPPGPYKEWQMIDPDYPGTDYLTTGRIPAFDDGDLPPFVGDTTNITYAPQHNNLWGTLQQKATIDVTPYVSYTYPVGHSLAGQEKICAGIVNSLSITINPLPITKFKPSTDNCIGDGTRKLYETVDGAPFSAYDWGWRSDPDDTPTVGGNWEFAPFISNPNNYPYEVYEYPKSGEWTGYITVRETNQYGCTGPMKEMFIQTVPAPVVSLGPDMYVCSGAPVQLSASVNGITDSNLLPSGIELDWFPTPDPGEAGKLDPLKTFYVIGSSPDVFTMSLRAKNGSCYSNLESIKINVYPLPYRPTLTTRSYCSDEPGWDMSVSSSNTDFRWYRMDGNDTLRIANSDHLPTVNMKDLLTHTNSLPWFPVSRDTTFMYGVSQVLPYPYTPAGGSPTQLYCASDISTAPMTIRVSPTAPIPRNLTYCHDENFPRYTIGATGTSANTVTLMWYNVPAGGISMGGGFTYDIWRDRNDVSTEIAGTPPTYSSFDYYASAIALNGCESPRVTVPLVIFPKPELDFRLEDNYGNIIDGVNTLGGCSPLTVSGFITQEPDVNYQWVWEYGLPEDVITPSPQQHQYETSGSVPENYTLSLIGVSTTNRDSITFQYCRKEVEQNVVVYPGVKADFVVTPENEGCDPLTMYFFNTSSNAYKFRWYWDWQSTDGPEPPYPGNPLNDRPFEQPNQIDPNLPFYGSIGTNPVKTFDNRNTNQPKDYHVWLQVDNNACYDNKEVIITVFPTPNASFNHNLQLNGEVCPPDPVIFTNNSTGTANSPATQYEWNFGDGTPVIDPGPYTYLFESLTASSPVPYMVTMTAFNEYISAYTGKEYKCSATDYKQVIVNPQVKAAFYGDTVACSPMNVTFTSSSFGAVSHYDWNFDDPLSTTPGSGRSITHRYENPTHNEIKKYNVTHTVSNNYGCRDAITQVFRLFPQPMASFEMENYMGCQPLEVTFINRSNYGTTPNMQNTLYIWDYRDADVDSLYVTSPPHTHEFTNTGGSNSVLWPTLTAENIYKDGDLRCKNSFSQQVTIYPYVKADFVLDDEEGCSPYTIRLRNASQGYASGLLDFGDGFTQTISRSSGTQFSYTYHNPSMFNNATYNLTLTVESGGTGCKSQITKPVTALANPTADFRPGPPYPSDYDYPAGPIVLDNLIPLPDRNYLTYLWSWREEGSNYDNYFPGGINPSPLDRITDWGTYYITQRVIAPNGLCEDRKTLTINIVPPQAIADFEYDPPTGCVPLTVKFYNNSKFAKSYKWDFGDGTPPKTEEHPFHDYTDAGEYLVTLTVTGDNPFPATSIPKKVVVHPKPQAAFDVGQKFLWVGLALRPENYSSHTYSNGLPYNVWYQWDWGDGTPNDTIESPSHMYMKSGEYTVTLTVGTDTDPQCVSVKTLPNSVELKNAGEMIMPNTFRPRSDGEPSDVIPDRGYKNYLFYPPVASPVTQYRFTIYSRWGQKLYETNDPDRGWTGYFRGRLCDEDVYIYEIKGVFETGQSFMKFGDILLLR